MSDSSDDGLSDLDDIDDLEMIMQQVQAEQEQEEEVERVRHRNHIYRERLDAEERLMADYFGPNPKYPEYYFRKQYRMSRKLFLEIVSGIENYIQTHHHLHLHFDFFRVRPDATSLLGFSVIMKCACAIHQLAYGVTADSLDGYLQMGNHCARDCLDFFTMCVIELFMPEYLRKPDFDDIQNLYTAHNNIYGFSRMLRSIDCMHWEWRNCSKAWHGQFAREGEIQSKDPFHIYELLVKKPKNDNKEEESSKATLKYPPGFTPDDVLRTKDIQDVDDVVEVQKNTQKSNKQDNFTKDNNVRGVTHSKEEDKESFCSGQFRRSVGGILCAWDPRMFHKHNAMISDYFVAIQGEWIENAKKYLVISVYAPQEASEKGILWSYLNHMID
nr:hypothetical protein [Tanacetum cinerariifolium]